MIDNIRRNQAREEKIDPTTIEPGSPERTSEEIRMSQIRREMYQAQTEMVRWIKKTVRLEQELFRALMQSYAASCIANMTLDWVLHAEWEALTFESRFWQAMGGKEVPDSLVIPRDVAWLAESPMKTIWGGETWLTSNWRPHVRGISPWHGGAPIGRSPHITRRNFLLQATNSPGMRNTMATPTNMNFGEVTDLTFMIDMVGEYAVITLGARQAWVCRHQLRDLWWEWHVRAEELKQVVRDIALSLVVARNMVQHYNRRWDLLMREFAELATRR